MTAPHIHVPFDQISGHMDFIKSNKLNLEIYLGSDILDTVSTATLQKTAEALDYSPAISIHAPFMDLSPAAVDSRIRQVTLQRIDQTCEAAQIFGAVAVVFHSGYEKWKYALDTKLWLEKSLETWLPVRTKFSAAGIKIAIENIFEEEPSNLRMLMEEMGSADFGICFDTGHFNLFSSVPLADWLDELGSYIVEMHLHDNDRSADQHNPIGEGSFDFNALFSRISRKDIIYTLEAHSRADAVKSMQRFTEFGL